MRKLYILIILLMAASCSLIGDQQLKQASWDRNLEEDLSHYNVFKWSGLDTTLTPFVDGEYRFDNDPLFVGFVNKGPAAGQQLYSLFVQADGITYTQIAVSAVDSSDNHSPIGLSNFIQPIDETSPGQVQNVVLPE